MSRIVLLLGLVALPLNSAATMAQSAKPKPGERLRELANVARHVPAGVDDRVPAASAQRPVVAGVPVTDQPRHTREQLGPGLAAPEQGHLGPGPQSILNDRAAHERCTTQNQNPHSPEPYPSAARDLSAHASAQQREQAAGLQA